MAGLVLSFFCAVASPGREANRLAKPALSVAIEIDPVL
jgi:hypothetical protein